MSRIAVLDDYQGLALASGPFDRLGPGQDGDGHEIVVFRKHLDGDDAVVEALADFDVVCCMRERTPFDAARLARLPRLKLLVSTGMRNAAIDVAAARSRGIVVCGTRAPKVAASELAWALVLGLQRRLVAEDGAMRAGGWQTTVGRDCHGLTLGLVGLGTHGARVARFGAAFGMRRIAWSTHLDAARCAEVSADTGGDDGGIRLVERETLFRDADVIVVNLVMGGRNRGLIGADELSLMKRDALVVNTSRGPIIDEAALIAALREGRIGGAGLDVYEREPLPADHPLRRCPNTLLTSHVGYVTRQTWEVFYGDTVASIEAWAAGKPVRELGRNAPPTLPHRRR